MTYSIEDFRALNQAERIIVTQHGRKRFAERGIKLSDICEAVNAGKIIEDYPNDFPFPSCLILGKAQEKYLHVCASLNDGFMYIITAYIPDPARWKEDLMTRKETSK